MLRFLVGYSVCSIVVCILAGAFSRGAHEDSE